MEDNTTPTAPAPAPMWSSIVKSQPPPKPNPETPAPSTGVFVVDNNNCNSTKGIAVAVVDANALIEGSDKLTRSADKLVTVPEVMAEVRDPASRHRLSFLLPSSLHSMDPSPDSLNKGISSISLLSQKINNNNNNNRFLEKLTSFLRFDINLYLKWW